MRLSFFHSVAILICMPAVHCTAYKILLPPGLSDLPHYYYHWAVLKLKRTFVFQSPLQKQTVITAILETGELSHRQITVKSLWCWPLTLGTTVAGCPSTQNETACGHCRTVGSMWFAQHPVESMAKAEGKARISTNHGNILIMAGVTQSLACTQRKKEFCKYLLKPTVARSGHLTWETLGKFPLMWTLWMGNTKTQRWMSIGSTNLMCQYQDTNSPHVEIAMHSKHSSHGFHLQWFLQSRPQGLPSALFLCCNNSCLLRSAFKQLSTSSVLAENQVLHICIPTLRLLAHWAHPDGRLYLRLNDLLSLPPVWAQ